MISSMDTIDKILRVKNLDARKIRDILDESLAKRGFSLTDDRKRLVESGLDDTEALKLLAFHRSKRKYGYEIDHSTLDTLLQLAASQGLSSPLRRLIQNPFFLMKACWLHEHAPYFLFYGDPSGKDLHGIILEFAEKYEPLLLKNRASPGRWSRAVSPKQVLSVTFWQKQSLDPVALIEKARRDNISGLELSVDFHPFNYSKLLPEEISRQKRSEIREACNRSGMKIDIHSPIARL